MHLHSAIETEVKGDVEATERRPRSNHGVVDPDRGPGGDRRWPEGRRYGDPVALAKTGVIGTYLAEYGEENSG